VVNHDFYRFREYIFPVLGDSPNDREAFLLTCVIISFRRTVSSTSVSYNLKNIIYSLMEYGANPFGACISMDFEYSMLIEMC